MVTLNFGGAEDMHRMSAEQTVALRRLNAAAQVPPTTYAVFQPERGETGTLHLQGYFEFEKRMTLAQVKKHLGNGVHLEVAAGTQQQCIDYCTKETDLDADPPVYGRIDGGEVVEFGEPMKLNKHGKTSGSRTDWADVLKMLKTGSSNVEVIEKHPAIAPNVRALQHVRFAYQCERSRCGPTKLVVFWGAPDTGKTTTARSLCEEGTYFILTADGKSLWWDGYDPDKHKTVIFDEFVGSRMPLTFLNQLADVLDINVQTKGGFSRFLADRIIITSNFSPREWYSACAEARVESLFRRITLEIEFMLVDQIIDLHGDPTKMERRLHLNVHKGKFNFGQINSRYPLDDCCKELLELHKKQFYLNQPGHIRPEAVEPVVVIDDIEEISELEESIELDTDAEVQRRLRNVERVRNAKRRRLAEFDSDSEGQRELSAQLGESQDWPVVVEHSSASDSDVDDPPSPTPVRRVGHHRFRSLDE